MLIHFTRRARALPIESSSHEEIVLLPADHRCNHSLGFDLRPTRAAQTTFGSITGVVTDPSGAAVPNAQITVVNQDTGFTRRQTTGVTGVYTVPDLVPGTYRVRCEGKGFNAQERRA